MPLAVGKLWPQPLEVPIILKRSMPPAGSGDARLLILGSLPGEASLKSQRYYAHPRNQFWGLLGRAIGEDLAGMPYDYRLVRLAAHRIALWDVVGEASRAGSLDGAIRGATPNQLCGYAETHPNLRAIAFNGKTAARIGRAALRDFSGVKLVDLPSSSPAFTLSFEEKAQRWALLGPLAWPPETATLES
jgi:TDG/mug DNA glycosylase family protein